MLPTSTGNSRQTRLLLTLIAFGFIHLRHHLFETSFNSNFVFIIVK